MFTNLVDRSKALIIPLALKPKSRSFAEAATLSGGATTAWAALFGVGIHAIKNAALPNRAHLRQLVALIDEGHVKPVIRQCFPLREARLTHELVETGHGQGRIILDIAP